MAVAKHFPGIGRTILDSHLDMPTLKTDLISMESVDLLPFKAAIKHDVAGIMLSHIYWNCYYRRPGHGGNKKAF
jgi:beta-N-acetylhexosaminidase